MKNKVIPFLLSLGLFGVLCSNYGTNNNSDSKLPNNILHKSVITKSESNWAPEKTFIPSDSDFSTEYTKTGMTVTFPNSASVYNNRYILKDTSEENFTIKFSFETNIGGASGNDFEVGYAKVENNANWYGIGMLFRSSGLLVRNDTNTFGAIPGSPTYATSDFLVDEVYKCDVELIKNGTSMTFSVRKSGDSSIYKTVTVNDAAQSGKPCIVIRNHQKQAGYYKLTNIEHSVPKKWAPAKTYIPGDSDFATEYTETGMKITFPNSAGVYNNRYILKDYAEENYTIKFSFETNIGGSAGNDFEVGYAYPSPDSSFHGIGMLFRSTGLLSWNKNGSFGGISGAPTYLTNDFKVGDVYKCNIEMIKNGTSMTLNVYKFGDTAVFKTVTVNDANQIGKPCIIIRNHQKQAGYYDLSNITLIEEFSPVVTLGDKLIDAKMNFDAIKNEYFYSPIDVNAEDELSFKSNGDIVEYQDGVSTNLHNHKILMTAKSAGIYLKNENDTWIVYVSGYTNRQFVINGNRYATFEKTDTNPYEYVLYGVEINLGDTIQAQWQNGDSYSIVAENAGRSIDFALENSVTISKTHGIYDLYLKSTDSINYDFFYVDYEFNFKNAFNFANTFVDEFGAICRESEQDQEYINTLKEKWNEMNGIYGSLAEDSKTYILNDDANFKFQEFYTKYDYIQAKYGFTNFLHRTPAQNLSYSVQLTDNSTIVPVLVLAFIGTVSLIGFVFYKKHKTI